MRKTRLTGLSADPMFRLMREGLENEFVRGLNKQVAGS